MALNTNIYRIKGDIYLTPNAFGDPNLVALRQYAGATIEVYAPDSGIDRIDRFNFRRWNISGRNTKLTGVYRSGYVYARISRETDDGEIIFSRHDYNIDGTATDDPTIAASTLYYYISIGTVSRIDVERNERDILVFNGELIDIPDLVKISEDLVTANKNIQDLSTKVATAQTSIVSINDAINREVKPSINTIDSQMSNINNKNILTSSDKKALLLKAEQIKNEYEVLADTAIARGVDEEDCKSFKEFSICAIKMIQHITSQDSDVPLTKDGWRLAIKFSEGEEYLEDFGRTFKQYDVAYTDFPDASRVGWSDYYQSVVYYDFYKMVLQDSMYATTG